MARILVVEDERVLARNLGEKLRAHGHDVSIAHTCQDALSIKSSFHPDVIVLDLRLPDGDGLKLLPQFKSESPSANVIVVTAHGNEQIAVRAMKAGAYDYLTKPVDLEELRIVVGRAVEHQRMSDNLAYLRHPQEERSGPDRLIGESEVILNLKETIRRLTQSEALTLPDPPVVLITGETGTGKALVARTIHYHGPRSKKPFLHVNCTALLSLPFESELSAGQPDASKSGAQAKRSLFDIAAGGTLFLDEVGQLDPDTQARLVHAIADKGIWPIGSTEARPADVHIMASSHQDLEAAVGAGEFREDLYHRLRVVQLHIPPLRERSDDVALLASHFLTQHCTRFRLPAKKLSKDATKSLRQQTWRGNVRELSHLIENCVLQMDGEIIHAADLRVAGGTRERHLRLVMPDGIVIRLDFETGGPTLHDVEQSILRTAYQYTGHNLSRAARILGITREALRYRLNKHSG